MIREEIFIVIVLYKIRLEDSETIKSLEKAFDKTVNLLIYDNSPNKQYEEGLFVYDKFNIQYHHDINNSGLSVAYNYALDIAFEANFKWILLLDQDTTITKDYIAEIEILDSESLPNSVAAIIPIVKAIDQDKIISPAIVNIGGYCKPIFLESGIPKFKISGINSGTLLNIYFIKSINGFNAQYALDMLDHWYFREIYLKKREVYVMKSVIYQNLSVYGVFEDNISINRYAQMLKAENLFNIEAGLLNLLAFKLRLCFRTFKQLKYVNKEYYKLTVQCILNLSKSHH